MLTLQGIRRLSQFDQIGFLFFDASRKGFWRSFGAALICLPVWAILEYVHIARLDHDVPHFIAMQGIAYAVGWLAYPLVALLVADMFGAWPNYYRYMVSYNWFQPVMQLMWLPVEVLEFLPGGETSSMPGLLALLIMAVQGVYGWFLARFGLGVSSSTALAMTVIDVGLGLLIDRVATQL